MIREKEQMSPEDWQKKMERKGLDLEGGALLPDPTPMAPPVGYKKTPSMVDYIRDMVRSEKLRQEAEAMGFESFEEAEDFDVEDEFEHDPRSVHEIDEDLESVSALKAKLKEAVKREREKAASSAQPSEAPASPSRPAQPAAPATPSEVPHSTPT